MSQKLKDHLEKIVRPMNEAITLLDDLILAEQKLGETKRAAEGEAKTLKALQDSRKRAEVEHERAMQEMETTRKDLKAQVDAALVKLNYEMSAAQESFRQRLVKMEKQEKELAQTINVAENRLTELMAKADAEEKRFEAAQDKLKALKDAL